MRTTYIWSSQLFECGHFFIREDIMENQDFRVVMNSRCTNRFQQKQGRIFGQKTNQLGSVLDFDLKQKKAFIITKKFS